MRRAALLGAVLAAGLAAASIGAAASWSAHTTNPSNSFGTASLGPPTGLGVSVLLTTATLTWTAPSAAQQGSGTKVERSDGGGAFTTVHTVTPGSVTSYNDTGLSLIVMYCWRLTTVLSNWTSTTTGQVCALG